MIFACDFCIHESWFGVNGACSHYKTSYFWSRSARVFLKDMLQRQRSQKRKNFYQCRWIYSSSERKRKIHIYLFSSFTIFSISYLCYFGFPPLKSQFNCRAQVIVFFSFLYYLFFTFHFASQFLRAVPGLWSKGTMFCTLQMRTGMRLIDHNVLFISGFDCSKNRNVITLYNFMKLK